LVEVDDPVVDIEDPLRRWRDLELRVRGKLPGDVFRVSAGRFVSHQRTPFLDRK
jgi:hypothetical protein